MSDPNDQFDHGFPQRLRDDLRAMHRPAPAVPPEVDDAILAAGRTRLRRLRTRRSLLRWGDAAVAAAAMLLLAIHVVLPPADLPVPAPTALHVKDINRDGTVDILDAFTLARRIERGEALDPAWDFTGDGTIGPADVDALAMAAVRLEGAAP